VPDPSHLALLDFGQGSLGSADGVGGFSGRGHADVLLGLSLASVSR